jgi:hypothetical protein
MGQCSPYRNRGDRERAFPLNIFTYIDNPLPKPSDPIHTPTLALIFRMCPEPVWSIEKERTTSTTRMAFPALPRVY